MTYSMSTTNNPHQGAFLPAVDISTQCSGVCHIIRTKRQTQLGLDLSNLSEYTLLGSQCVTAQCPELDVFHTTTCNRVLLVRVELDIEDL